MRYFRVAAKQAHYVPQAVTRPRGPFPAELYQSGPVVNTEPEEEFPPGATAQNNFRPEPILQCRLCLAMVAESETVNHICPD